MKIRFISINSHGRFTTGLTLIRAAVRLVCVGEVEIEVEDACIRVRGMTANDPKLSDGGAWRGSCEGEAQREAADVGQRWLGVKTPGQEIAATVTRGAVRCSAWLGVAVIASIALQIYCSAQVVIDSARVIDINLLWLGVNLGALPISTNCVSVVDVATKLIPKGKTKSCSLRKIPAPLSVAVERLRPQCVVFRRL